MDIVLIILVWLSCGYFAGYLAKSASYKTHLSWTNTLEKSMRILKVTGMVGLAVWLAIYFVSGKCRFNEHEECFNYIKRNDSQFSIFRVKKPWN